MSPFKLSLRWTRDLSFYLKLHYKPGSVKGDKGRRGEEKGGSDVHQAVLLLPVCSSCPMCLSSHVSQVSESIKARWQVHRHTWSPECWDFVRWCRLWRDRGNCADLGEKPQGCPCVCWCLVPRGGWQAGGSDGVLDRTSGLQEPVGQKSCFQHLYCSAVERKEHNLNTYCILCCQIIMKICYFQLLPASNIFSLDRVWAQRHHWSLMLTEGHVAMTSVINPVDRQTLLSTRGANITPSSVRVCFH